MMNQTITGVASEITYENVTLITQHPVIIFAHLVIWLLPLLIYILVGSFARARSPSGQVYSKRMIQYPNFWWAFFIWFFIQGALFVIILTFPIWLKVLT